MATSVLPADDWAAAPELRIDTATGIAVHLPLAGPGARSFAFLLDWVIRSSAAVGWYLLAAWAVNGRITLGIPDDAETLWYMLVALPASAIYFLYHIVLEVALRGRTPGKRMAGVRVVGADGRTASAGALLLRNVFRLVDAMPFAYAVGLAFVFGTRRHVRVGDLAAGTVLVYDQLVARTAVAPSMTYTVEEALAPLSEYRALAREVAIARRSQPLTARAPLEARYGELHATVEANSLHWGYALWSLFRDQLPAALYAMRAHLLWTTLWFLLCVFAGGWLVSSYPDLIALFASPDMIATVERGELWTDSLLNVTPSSVLSIDLLTNNIVVALFAFVSGFLFGLGTLYIIGTNGLLIGALFAFTAHHGLDDRLFQFIIAHGPVELACICVAGSAGAYAGEALFRSNPGERAIEFASASKQGGKILLAVSVLLLGCGFIEGYISPDLDIPLWPRVVIGVGYSLFMLALLSGALFGRSRNRNPISV